MRQPYRPLLTYSGGAAIAFLGTWAVTVLEARRDTPEVPRIAAPGVATVSESAPVELAPLAYAVSGSIEWSDEPELSPDSLAALLIDTTRSRRSQHAEIEMLHEIVSVAEQIWSNSERADVLAEIAELPRLDSSVVRAVGRASMRLSSPSARAKVLRTLILRHPAAVGAARATVLDAAGSMPGSSERVSTLHLFVTRPHLSQESLADALAHIGRISSSSDRSSVLIAAARANRIDGRVRSLYIQAASGIRSERDRSRALAAIGVRGRSRGGV